MKIDIFRDDEFVNREKEIKYLKDRFSQTPKEILWLFGPKSTGKTTLIEYVIETKLPKDYFIKYINFRGLMVSNYRDFISAFFEEKDEEEKQLNRKYNLGIFQLEAKTLKKIAEHKKNLFNELIEEFKKIKEKKIIIIDEIQTLEDIYMDDKLLLKEFLNFCVRLTKELHLAHVVILSSNTIFINQIYNEAKLKVTSRFVEINHMDKETIFEYLDLKEIKEKELVWEYLGGSIAHIQRMIRDYHFYNSLKEYLENEVELAKGEIDFFMLKKCSLEEIEIFEDIAKEIVKNGEYILDKHLPNKDKIMAVLEKFAEIEFIFYNPLNNKITANNRVYYKAFERL